MKVLILSCNTGEGHNSAGRALSDYFTRRGVECEMLNALKFYPRALAALISKGHVFIYRKLPLLFGAGYRMEEKHTSKLMIKGIEEAAEALCRYIEAGGYDAVLCVHPFPALMMTRARRSFGLKIPQYFFATDYTCSPSVNETDMDAYFIPRGTKAEFVACGLPAERMVESGIPVQEAFYAPRDREGARRALNIDPDCRLLLLMCGSMGCGPIEELVDTLAGQLGGNARLIAVCGSNKRLYAALQEKKLPDHIRILGYTNDMRRLMDASDVFLSKPGGLSSTEAMVRRLPMVAIDAVPGCETRNLEFFLSHGYVTTADTVEALAERALDLLNHPDKTEGMRRAVERDFSTCAVEEAYQYIMRPTGA